MKLKLFLGIVSATLFFWVLATAVLAQGEPPPPYAGLKNPFPWTDTSAQETGKGIYEHSCRSCHGASGNNVPIADFSTTNYSSNLQARPDYYFWVTSEGRLDKGMPAYNSYLSDEQRWQVLTYVWSLGTRVVGNAIPGPSSLSIPLENGVLPDCLKCHTRGLKSHDKLGPGSAACVTCHSNINMGMLRLFNGAEIPQADSPKLCGQCHSDFYDAWQKGTHGVIARDKVISGIPTNVKPKCADCHDPHQPQISLSTGTILPSKSTKDGKLDCLACHVRVLKGHDKLGSGSEACWACHLSTEMTTLHLAGEETGFPLSESTKLCAQCHQARYQAWTEGTHGVAGWKEGDPAFFGSEKVKCTNCHDPHQPQMPLLGITKPHPAPAPSPPEPPSELLKIIGISLALTIGIGIAVVRGGGGP